MSAFPVLPFSLLGAVLGIDVVSFPQAMLSRPIVAATLAGALEGHAGRGLLVGVALELFALETLPFGASRYPEWGSSSVVGGALFAAHGDAGGDALAFAVLAGLVTAAVGGWSMVVHRRLIAHWAGGLREAIADGSAAAVTQLQLSGLVADLVRGGVVTTVALVMFGPLARALFVALPAGSRSSGAVVAALAGATAGAAVWSVVHSSKGASWVLAGGLAVGTGLALAL